ncbi:hypothetical protein M9H77_02160 [Catharanthus roseus]|uniref:Uncharacterized protein n=1 Tax=Catharanthus roseus TaxID=4058 RepID=A0ACC0C7I9_CATRO|nr:hypothetical protein M9H77_02160 [Catharanthus roseus]
MSAIVCGKRSNFFEDLQSSSPSPPSPVSKRIRCSSSSPVRFSPPAAAGGAFSSFSVNFISGASSSSLALDHLVALFPDMDKQKLKADILELTSLKARANQDILIIVRVEITNNELVTWLYFLRLIIYVTSKEENLIKYKTFHTYLQVFNTFS